MADNELKINELEKADVKFIEISKIDPNIIPLIRNISNDESDDFKVLDEAIKKDGQQFPIIIRKLTEEELTNPTVREGAEFGIIDGHHRFRIAELQEKKEILAKIDDTEPDSYHDVLLAFRLNESSIKMTPIEKGKIIFELQEKYKKKVEEIGKEVFGLAHSMAFRCLNSYKQSNNISVISKPRRGVKDFNASDFQKTFKESIKTLQTITKSQRDFQILLEDSQKCTDALKQIESFEKQLKLLKKKLNQTTTKTENTSKSENETVADNNEAVSDKAE